MTVVPGQQINGLMPGLDPKQVQVAHILNGRNFVVNLRGPKTSFGGSLLNWHPFANPAYIQSLPYGDGYLYFATDGIYTRYPSFPVFTLFYSFSTPAVEKAPWTSALVGGRTYFCKKGQPIIQVDPVAHSVKEITTDVATGPVAITQSGGRLIILAEAVVQWSAIDDGEDLAVDPDKGVGAQLLALVGGGDPLIVKEVAQGFVTYTKRGVIFSQLLSSGTLPFRHRVLPADTVPVSAFAVADIDRQAHMVFADTGFYIVADPEPKSWQPLFGEHLRSEWVPQLQADPGSIQLFYDANQQLLYVALNTTAEYRTYKRTFVNFMPRENAWGSCDVAHRGLIATLDGTAIVQPDGYVLVFDDTFARQTPFNLCLEFPFHSFDIVGPAFVADDVLVFSNYLHLCPVNPDDYAVLFAHLVYEQSTQHTIWSEPVDPYLPEFWDEPFSDDEFFNDEQGFGSLRHWSALSLGAGFVTTAPAIADTHYESMDAEFTIGLFRLLGEEHIDRLSDLYSVNVAFAALVDPVSTVIDWATGTGMQDWNVQEGLQDWGVLGSAELQFTFEVFGSRDGFEDWPYDNRVVPKLAVDAPTLQMYQCDLTAYYFGVRVATNEPYSGAEIRMLEFAASLAGRV